jgi:ADP-ribose pyrophosphatase YjhB (NUDIX family)
MASSSESHHPGPHLAVSIGVWKGDAVLLVKRGKGAARGLWAFPGGRVEPGERLEAAALRELAEETSVSAAIERRLDVIELIRAEDGSVEHHYVLVAFRGRYLGGAPAAGDDAAEARWFRPEQLSGIEMTPDTERLVAQENAR